MTNVSMREVAEMICYQLLGAEISFCKTEEEVKAAQAECDKRAPILENAMRLTAEATNEITGSCHCSQCSQLDDEELSEIASLVREKLEKL